MHIKIEYSTYCSFFFFVFVVFVYLLCSEKFPLPTVPTVCTVYGLKIGRSKCVNRIPSRCTSFTFFFSYDTCVSLEESLKMSS